MYKTFFFLSSLLLSPHVSAADPELKADLVQRRQAVMEGMDKRGMLILFSADSAHYSGDVDYEFRQSTDSPRVRQSTLADLLWRGNQPHVG